jgi:hypothetical protein
MIILINNHNTITLTILDEKLEQMKSCYSYRTFFYYMKVHGEDGHCSWYGECGQVTEKFISHNVVSSTPRQ